MEQEQRARRRSAGRRRDWRARYRIVDDRQPGVLLAEERALRRRVVIRVRQRPRGPSPLVREAQVLMRAARNNRNVPHVLDRWFDGDDEYLALEYVAGVPLAQLLESGRGQGKPYFAPEQCHRMVLGLIKGLRGLHRSGICHGDLKPANLVVASGNRLVMIDFGSAWSGAARPGARDRGSEGYAAPEQWREEALVDPRADQFSVSVILYQLLTNDLPYDGLGGRVVDYWTGGEAPQVTPPSALASARRLAGMSWTSLDRVVERGLALDKDSRFETTEAWLRAFEAAGSAPQARRGADLMATAFRGWLARIRRRFRRS